MTASTSVVLAGFPVQNYVVLPLPLTRMDTVRGVARYYLVQLTVL